MPSLASISDPKVYHILTYGTLLGSSVFQTFLNGPVAYKALPRPNFSQLQQAIFPPFFAFHTALPLALALSWPGEKVASVAGAVARQNSGWQGLLQESNFWSGLAPIAVMFVTGFVNMVALGPMTTKVMRERKHQETKDGKRYYDAGPQSNEMQRLNSAFMWMHSASSITNLVSLGAMLYYGAVLAEKL